MSEPAAWIVIPARMGSTRLPGKPLAPVRGVPMIGRVVERALRVSGVDRVVVATDHAAIADVAEAFGATAVLTGPARSGTHRVAEAVAAIGWRGAVVNLQGDQPLVDPASVGRVVARLAAGAAIATLAAPYLGDPTDPHRVKVIVAGERALWFSRAAIPVGGPWWQHVGVYGFAPGALAAAVAAPPGGSAGEDLEQLAWLEAGLEIAVDLVDDAPPGVDTPEQLAIVEARLDRL